MDYIAYFNRQHKTRMVSLSLHSQGDDADDFQVPYRETVAVPVGGVEFDPTQLAEHPKFVALAQAAAEAAYPLGDEWVSLDFEGARQDALLPPLPELLTPVDSPAYILMRAHARKYPTLYGDDEFTPFRVWEQWFFTIGNGMDWLSDGTLDDSYDPTSLATRLAAAHELLAQPLSEKALAEVARDRDYRQRDMSRPYPHIPVKLYPGSRRYSAIFELPENVEPSFLAAALDICRYFLTRPVWQCCAYYPHERNNQQGLDVYNKDEVWRPMMLADGATYRAMVSDAFAEVVAYSHRGQVLKLAGYKDEAHPFITDLPPRWVAKSYAPDRKSVV